LCKVSYICVEVCRTSAPRMLTLNVLNMDLFGIQYMYFVATENNFLSHRASSQKFVAEMVERSLTITEFVCGQCGLLWPK